MGYSNRDLPTTCTKKSSRRAASLTPVQLARKRACDREAQRLLRARTKDHIVRLERDLEELKTNQSQNDTIRELESRNRTLEEELVSSMEYNNFLATLIPYYFFSVTPSRHDIASPRQMGLPTTPSECKREYGSAIISPSPRVVSHHQAQSLAPYPSILREHGPPLSTAAQAASRQTCAEDSFACGRESTVELSYGDQDQQNAIIAQRSQSAHDGAGAFLAPAPGVGHAVINPLPQ
ncbi:hypothetical protein HG530_014764 [Fusarium avenaceum]|nr:hypothetical protein HG530_014764 [Fusarium avenaceum]KIL92347.1 hypothetical protein FAVG1_04757 [Fusarium avenaceum]